MLREKRNQLRITTELHNERRGKQSGTARKQEQRVELSAGSGPPATHLHHSDLLVAPGIHGHRAHEAEVDAEPAVQSAALQAHEDAVGH